MPKKKAPKKKSKTPANNKIPKADGIAVHCSHTALVDTESVVPNPGNPNHHPQPQVELLAKIIAGQGWRNPIVISARSGFVVKGHCRLLAAQHLKVKTVPVDIQQYATEASEHADLIAADLPADQRAVDQL